MTKLDLPFAGWQRARRDDPETSKLAAERVGPRAGTHAGKILLALVEHGPMNFSEIARASGLKESQVWRRMSEMERAGYVEVARADDWRSDAGEEITRKGDSGDRQRVWRVVTGSSDAGRGKVTPDPMKRRCAHGNPLGECNACDVQSDFAYDAARERATFGRR